MTDWAIPQQAKLKYTQLFNLHDRSRSGFLSGLQCRDILMQSGLPRNILAEIWNLSDIDGDGQLTREEFILAMHLTNQVRAGQTLPHELPADLVPPSYRRTRSISATSVHSTTSATSSASSGIVAPPTAAPGTFVPPTSISDDQAARKSSEISSGGATVGSMLNSNSFEDKRRENFEKGRAELERRRLKMIEQQSSVISEQLVKCKKQVAEAKSKIDSMRSERDTKAGLITSLEAQLKTVRDRKAFLDHEELQIIAIARDLNLVNSSHSAALDQQATRAKQENINQMKEKLLDMEKEKDTKVKQLSEAQAKLEESKKELKSISDEANKVYENYKEKVTNAKVLREQFVLENKSKPIDLDSAWDSTSSPAMNHADAFKTEPTSAFPVSNDDPWASSSAFATNTKPAADDPFAFNKNDPVTPTNDLPGFNNNNDSNFEPTRDYSSISSMIPKPGDQSSQGPSSSGFGDSSAPDVSTRKKMYRVLYEFEARNPDELTIKPGDIVVGSDVVCEPGWLSGETGGKSGLFPEAYVEPLPADEYPMDPQQVAQPASTTSAPTEVTSTTAIKFKVIYAFEAMNPDELTINPGDIITGVDAPHEPGWLMGELNGQRGLFPEAYVEKFAEASIDQAAAGPAGKSRAKKAEVATVIANYRALGQEQLNLEKGQLVLIRRKMDSGWWEGELQIKDHDKLPNGRHGPSGLGHELDHLINELVDSELDYVNDLRLCQNAYIRPLSKSFDVSHIFINWGQLIDKHEVVLKSISEYEQSSTSDGQQALEYAFVLERFQDLLRTITDLYVNFCSRQNESARQLEAKIASDIRFRQLVSESQRKLRKLIECQGAVADNQDNKNHPDVKRALQNANLPLTTFLLKPMQRITKYGLLFDRMLSVVVLSLIDTDLQERIKNLKMSAQLLCNQVNEACRLKEDDEHNVRRLLWCQNHIKQNVHQLTGDGLGSKNVIGHSPLSIVDLRLSGSDLTSLSSSGRPPSMSESPSSSRSSLAVRTDPVEQIEFNSNTNCMGPRRFIKAGSMVKLRSGRELMVFLFSDFLLLTQIKSGGSQRVEDLFRSERAQQAYYKFYKPPIMLEDLQLDEYENDLNQLHASSLAACANLNSLSPASSLKEQENLIVSFLDRHTGSIYNLIAMSPRERSEWDKLLGEHSLRAKEARAFARPGPIQPRPLSVNECVGRLFVTVVELVRIASSSAPSSATARLQQQAVGRSSSNSSWERRISSVSRVDHVQNLSIRLQLKLYKRTQILVDDNEKREIIPTSEEFRTKAMTISNATRQPAMVDMNEAMSNLDLQKDVFVFDNESTQFLIAGADHHRDRSEGTEYLEIELVDESRFRETKQLGRKRVSLDQLLGRGETHPTAGGPGDDSPLCRRLSTRSVRPGQALQPNRPVEMVFKLKSIVGGDPKTQRASLSSMSSLSVEPQKFSVKLKLHLQLFCDINNLI